MVRHIVLSLTVAAIVAAMMAASAVPAIASVKSDGGDFTLDDFDGVRFVGFGDSDDNVDVDPDVDVDVDVDPDVDVNV